MMSETGASSGLTSAEAARRFAQYGPNEPVRLRRLSALHQLVRLFATPLVAILLVASIISVTLGQRTDAVIIITIVVLGVALNFWQTYRSGVAAEKLKASVMPTATVRRDGAWNELPVRVVVPGDVFRLSAGDLIPADGRLVESKDLAAPAHASRVRPFARDQLPMPPQQGVGGDDRCNVMERLPSQAKGPRGESPPVVISEARAPPPSCRRKSRFSSIK